MQPFILVRPLDNESIPAYKRLIREYTMSFAFNAFVSCIFKEVFLYLVVLVMAVMFIFFHAPLQFCLLSLPLVTVFLYASVYSTYFAKSFDLINEPITTCWVAEAYEPHLYALNNSGTDSRDYPIRNEDQIQTTDLEISRMKRTIIATISLDRHRQLPDAGWLHHFAISKQYDSERIIKHMIQRALSQANDEQYKIVELATTECQHNLRESSAGLGFEFRQCYHQLIMGMKDFRIMKTQMAIELKNSDVTKKQKWT